MAITILEMLIAFLLITAVILQQRGTQSGVVFGGGGGQTYRSKKGIEKLLFYSTIILALMFAGLSMLGVLI
jgi:protein translocase SecG subunit